MEPDIAHYLKPQHVDDPQRLGAEIRRNLRHLPEGSAMVLDLRTLQPFDTDEATFEVITSLNCCSPRAVLRERRIVPMVDSPVLRDELDRGLRAIGWTLLTYVSGEFVQLGESLDARGARLLDLVEKAGAEGIRVRELCAETGYARPVVDQILVEMATYGLVALRRQPNGVGRPLTICTSTLAEVEQLIGEVQREPIPVNPIDLDWPPPRRLTPVS